MHALGAEACLTLVLRRCRGVRVFHWPTVMGTGEAHKPFNIFFLAPALNPPCWGPRKSLCTSLPRKVHRGSQVAILGLRTFSLCIYPATESVHLASVGDPWSPESIGWGSVLRASDAYDAPGILHKCSLGTPQHTWTALKPPRLGYSGVARGWKSQQGGTTAILDANFASRLQGVWCLCPCQNLLPSGIRLQAACSKRWWQVAHGMCVCVCARSCK